MSAPDGAGGPTSSGRTPSDSNPSQSAPSRRTPSRRTVLLTGSAGAVLAMLAGLRVWAAGTVVDPVLGRAVVTGSGTQLAAGALGASVIALAGLLAVTLAGRTSRIVASVAVALAAGYGISVAGSVVADPARALAAAAGTAVGRAGVAAVDATATVWPWVAVVGLVTAGGCALVALGVGHRWPRPGIRYDSPVERPSGSDARRAATAAAAASESDWDRLSRGEDPTAD